MTGTGRAAGTAPFRLFVSVGTDYHPFQRLVDWTDEVLARSGAEVEALVQFGSSQPPRRAEGQRYLTHEELQSILGRVDLVVCHGGPATITEARRAGHLPVVVPRQPALGEHVDDHQVLFSRRLRREGLVELADSVDDLALLVDVARVTPERFRLNPAGLPGSEVPSAVWRVGELVDDLVAESAPSRARSRDSSVRRLLGRGPAVPVAGRAVLRTRSRAS